MAFIGFSVSPIENALIGDLRGGLVGFFTTAIGASVFDCAPLITHFSPFLLLYF
jgi:hypothetical protein